MGRRRRISPVKLFVGLLSGDPDLLRRTRQLLARSYGPVDTESPLEPFDHTVYYEPEMGGNLQRCFVSFKPLIAIEELAQIKRATIDLEQRIAEDTLAPVPRPVNIDPGYLDVNKVVLATTKDANHRIYVGRHIYAESTLRYVDGTWQPWPWTYADYAAPKTRAFFETLREHYREQRKAYFDRDSEAGAM